MEKSKNLWVMLAMFLLGTVLGFLFAPIRHGVRVRVMNNGNHYGSCDCEDLADYDEYYEEDFDDEDFDDEAYNNVDELKF